MDYHGQADAHQQPVALQYPRTKVLPSTQLVRLEDEGTSKDGDGNCKELRAQVVDVWAAEVKFHHTAEDLHLVITIEVKVRSKQRQKCLVDVRRRNNGMHATKMTLKMTSA